ncbi:MAG: hypothetical protein H6883_11530 [Rhodobiaceae bacterium]|nr:hypothetical protein [Rhodobiaceae bacterium]
MKSEHCILTTKEHSILEAMLQHGLDRNDPFKRLLERKLAAATVVLRNNVPADVATLNSRLVYRMGTVSAGYASFVMPISRMGRACSCR